MLRLTTIRGTQGSYGSVTKQLPLYKTSQKLSVQSQTSLSTGCSGYEGTRAKWDKITTTEGSFEKRREKLFGQFGMPKPGVSAAQLKGQHDEPGTSDQSPYMEMDWQEMGLQPHRMTRGAVIQLGRHTTITKGGRIYGYSGLVVAGDGKGTAGIGYGKGDSAETAIKMATLDVEKNLMSVYRFEDRTISHDVTVKYRATKLVLRRHHKGAGLRGHPTLSSLAYCFGFEDMLFKIHGSVNAHNILRAFIEGVKQSVSPAETARKEGRVYIDVTKVLNPQLNETPFKFSTMTGHQLWTDNRYFQDSTSVIEEGIVYPGAPTVDLEEKELKVARLYQRRMEELKKEIPDVDASVIDYAKKRIPVF